MFCSVLLILLIRFRGGSDHHRLVEILSCPIIRVILKTQPVDPDIDFITVSKDMLANFDAIEPGAVGALFVLQEIFLEDLYHTGVMTTYRFVSPDRHRWIDHVPG